MYAVKRSCNLTNINWSTWSFSFAICYLFLFIFLLLSYFVSIVFLYFTEKCLMCAVTALDSSASHTCSSVPFSAATETNESSQTVVSEQFCFVSVRSWSLVLIISPPDTFWHRKTWCSDINMNHSCCFVENARYQRLSYNLTYWTVIAQSV
jgi:hypothetical protein